MAAQALDQRFASAQVSVSRRLGGSLGVGIIFQDPKGGATRRIGYVSQDDQIESAVYAAVIRALEEAADARVVGLTLYLDQPSLVDQLNRRVAVPPDLRPLFVMARCRANALGRVRFEVGRPRQGFSARRLARSPALDSQPVCADDDTPALTLNLGE